MHTFKCKAIIVIVLYFVIIRFSHKLCLFLFVCLIFIFGLTGSHSNKHLYINVTVYSCNNLKNQYKLKYKIPHMSPIKLICCLEAFLWLVATVRHCTLCETNLTQANSRAVLSVVVKVTYLDTVCVLVSFLRDRRSEPGATSQHVPRMFHLIRAYATFIITIWIIVKSL